MRFHQHVGFFNSIPCLFNEATNNKAALRQFFSFLNDSFLRNGK
jgi:hypothetical protein